MRDIKALLKQARDAIKNKEYHLSLKICKSILREDKSNYTAMVFLGVSLAEVGPKDQALKAFDKAISLNPTNVLGWNGFISYLEKNSTEDNKKELVKCYCEVLRLETTEKRIISICEHLLSLRDYGSITYIGELVYEASNKADLSEESSIQILKMLAEDLAKIADQSEMYEKCLSDLVTKNNVTVKTKYYPDLLNLINKQENRTVDLLKNAISMSEALKNDTYSLNWICKIFNEMYVERVNNTEEVISQESIKCYCEKLLGLEPENAIGLFTSAIFLYEENRTVEAKDIMIRVTTQRPGLIYAWSFLTAIFLKLYLYEDAMDSLQKLDKLLQSINYAKVILKDQSAIFRIISLSKLNDIDNWDQAVTLFNEITETNVKNECLFSIIDINIKLEKYAEAQQLLSDAKSINEEKYWYLSAVLLRKQKRYKEALNLLETNTVNTCDWWIVIGLTYWDLGEYKKVLIPFLKATKCDPNNYLCFLHLGNYYKTIVSDFDKARRCYEKAFQLNSRCSQAGIELNNIYRQNKNWEANLSLLHSITNSSAINKNNSWAWFQLGLTYLDKEDYAKAIDILRFVVRIDRDNVHCWEALGDAYFARGSYTSSLKCYQRALELTDDTLYASLQVANIKMILGEFVEAKADFEVIFYQNGQYVPALKGLAETSLGLAKQCVLDQRLGTARDNAQYALGKLTSAVEQRSDLACLWKLLGDTVLLVAKLPEKHCCLFVRKSLFEGKPVQEEELLEKDDLFNFAAKCYCKCINLLQNNTLLWHDLCTCYLLHAASTEDADKKETLFNYALATAQHCTATDPSNWQHWNLLGSVAFLKDPPDYALAQHAFIKAVTIDHNCAISWCNLGVIYLIMGDTKLANQAFSQGQRSNPNYVGSWVGQAIIAEKIGHEDAMDLYRHSTQLNQNQQGGIGYGHWVCKVLTESQPDDFIYAIQGMSAIPVACDALTWYIEKNPYNACAWNMLGILYERLGLRRNALEAFRNAYRSSSDQYRDKARVNYARLLDKSGEYKKAIEIYQEVREATFKSGSGLAIALFKDNQYEESFNAYEQALHWLTEEQTHQSELLVALASIAYMFQGAEVAKTLLFQSIALKPASPWSLYATMTLGLIEKDLKLAKLVLNELDAVKDRREYVRHYAALIAAFYVRQGNFGKAVKEVSKVLHKHPVEANAWLTLALLGLEADSRFPLHKCSLTAMTLGRERIDVAKFSHLINSGNVNRKFSQKAIMCYPQLHEEFMVLLSKGDS